MAKEDQRGRRPNGVPTRWGEAPRERQRSSYTAVLLSVPPEGAVPPARGSGGRGIVGAGRRARCALNR
jgi:hypothetical protein